MTSNETYDIWIPDSDNTGMIRKTLNKPKQPDTKLTPQELISRGITSRHILEDTALSLKRQKEGLKKTEYRKNNPIKGKQEELYENFQSFLNNLLPNDSHHLDDENFEDKLHYIPVRKPGEKDTEWTDRALDPLYTRMSFVKGGKKSKKYKKQKNKKTKKQKKNKKNKKNKKTKKIKIT